MEELKDKKIIFAGGGTGGSVTPLLAIAEELISNIQFPIANFLWLGTKNGVEKDMVGKIKITYRVVSAGKLRRYWSWRNISDMILIIIGFSQSLGIISRWKPDLVMCSGGFVGVPVVWAAWILRVPVMIHQQDIRPGLANKLMAPFSRIITVTFEESLTHYGKKAVWTGNPVRHSLINKSKQTKVNRLNLKNDMPVVLIIGGGTGAQAINNLVGSCVKELTKFCQVLHIAGKGKRNPIPSEGIGFLYKQYEFLDAVAIAEAYRVADLVVSRCGMNVLTELAYLGKPAILIPIPDSHQEDNAAVFKKTKAAIVLDQKELDSKKLINEIRHILHDSTLRDKLSGNIKSLMKPDANQEMIKAIEKLFN